MGEENLEASELMNNLFLLDLHEPLREIFLHLDPSSLKNCKLVNHKWCEFIDRSLWGTRTGRRALKERLLRQWTSQETEANKSKFHTGRDANYLVSDDDIAVLGFEGNKASVLDLSSGEVKCQIECGSGERSWMIQEVQLDIGPTVIAAINSCGTVSLWDRKTFSLLYQAQHHGRVTVFGLRVVSSTCVLTGGEDGGLAVVQKVGQDWSLIKQISDNKEGVSHIDSDGKWAVIGTRKQVKLLDLESHQFVDNGGHMPVHVCMLAFRYPLVFVVGGSLWGGVQVWDVTSGLQLRVTLQEDLHFHNIHASKYFVTVSQLGEISNDYDSDDDCEEASVNNTSVFLYNLEELKNQNISDKQLWKKEFVFSGPSPTDINAVSNTTSLLVSQSNNEEIIVFDFWNIFPNIYPVTFPLVS